MQSMKRFVLLVAGVLLIVTLLVQARRMQRGGGRAAGEKDLAAKVATPAPDVRAEGWIVAYPGADVTVGTDVAGTVVRMAVAEKDRVRKGQLIAELRADDTRAALEEARARVTEAEADMHLFEAEVARAQRLYDEKVGTRQALDRAIRDRDAAHARQETALATVRRLEAQLDKTRIYAPIRGVVLSRLVQPGETVKENSPLIQLADLDRTRIEVEVDEFDASRVQIGSEVKIRAEGYDSQEWRGRVEEIPDSVVGRRLKPQDPSKPIDTRVLLVKVAFAEATPLKLGQKVEVGIGQQVAAASQKPARRKAAGR
jgi:RND family efflux transporter MFP subunit